MTKGVAPPATTPPRISGTARVGQTGQAETGVWSPTAGSYRYEWRLAGTRLNTTTKTLTLTPAMQNKPITVTVNALKSAHHDSRATSPPLTIRAS